MVLQSKSELKKGWGLLTEQDSKRNGVVSSLWRELPFCNIILGVEHPHQLEQVCVEFKSLYNDKLTETIDVEGLKIKYFINAKGEVNVSISRNLDSSFSIFETITNDILETISKPLHESVAAVFRSVDNRIRIWLNFLKRKTTKQLSFREQIGLFGELKILKALKARHANELTWINSWKGPEKHEKDYICQDFELEVKSILTDEYEIKISSLRQLEINKKCPLYLTILKLEETSEGESLSTLVEEILALFESELSRDIFASKLSLIGYSHLDKELYVQKFTVRNDVLIEVNESFPRLTTSAVDSQILRASYVISIEGLEQFIIKENQIYGEL